MEKVPTLAEWRDLNKKFVNLCEKYAELMAQHNRLLADLKYEQGLGHGGVRPKRQDGSVL